MERVVPMTSDLGKQIHSTIRWVPDFPQDGIHFADLTPVLVIRLSLMASCTRWQSGQVTQILLRD